MYECYFYVEPPSQDSDKARVQALCLECGKKYKEDIKGYYYQGDFGHKKDVVCYKCKSIIRKYEE